MRSRVVWLFAFLSTALLLVLLPTFPAQAGNVSEPVIMGYPIKPMIVQGDVKPPELITKVEPVYPDNARRAHIEGRVILQATINELGDVADLQVLECKNLLFKEGALKAVMQWKYKPATLKGKPVPVHFTVNVEYHLKSDEPNPSL